MSQTTDTVHLIDLLLDNRISWDELATLRAEVSENYLACIIQHIYDLNQNAILKISSLEWMLKKLDELKNDRRNRQFFRKIRSRFRNSKIPGNQVVLAEGDSWFNYPILLTDLIDRISMEQDFSVYSIAKGGDWLLNMLEAKKYVEELSILHPDWFLISGGGNDLVGSYRLAAMLEPAGDAKEFEACAFAMDIMNRRIERSPTTGLALVVTDMSKFKRGVAYLSKDFFALLMFFHLQYYFLIGGILHAGNKKNKRPKFDGIRIITQGYDYPIPSYNKGFGYNPVNWYIPFVRLFLGHGHWLKTPLQVRGVNDPAIQQDILYAMITLFNEMMIQTGALFNSVSNRVFHIDSRGSVGADGWTDELHPKPAHFMDTGQVFVSCMRAATPDYNHVFVVKPSQSKP